MGQAVGLWGRHLGTTLVAVRSSAPEVIAYASATPSTGRLTTIVINRTAESRVVRLRVEGQVGPAGLAVEQLAGDNPAATTVTLERFVLDGAADGTWSCRLPAYSASACTLSTAPWQVSAP